MTDEDVPKGWWAKQSSGAKLAIGLVGACCIGLILIVGLAGMMAPDSNSNTQATTNTGNAQAPATTSNSQQATADSKESYIEVSYPGGSWDGSITIQSGSNEEEINFDGSGTKRFDLKAYAGKDVYVMAQKEDGSSGKLSAVVVRDGENKLSQSTTEGYGIVNGWVFSWS